MIICHKIVGVTQEEKVFRVFTDGIEFRIMFLTNEILRIRAGFDGDFAEESYSLTMTAWEDRMDDMLSGYRHRIEAAQAILTEEENKYILKGKKLLVELLKEPFQILVYDEDGTLLHEDIPWMGWQKDANNRRIHTNVMCKEDNYYGFGERTGKLNKREQFLKMASGDTMGYNAKETDPLYKHIPFYIKLNSSTKKAVGYFYHNTFEGDFNMGRTHSNYVKHHTTYRTDGGDIDLFLIAGPSMREIIERYTDLTGKSVLLPKTALGYLGSSMYYPELPKDADDAILGFIDTTVEEGIPVDGFQLSSGYCEINTEEGMKRCTFTWNREKFKNPGAFFKNMKEKGITVSPNVKPGFLLSHPMIEQMKKQGMFVKDSKVEEPAMGLWWGGMGYYVDFTKESNRKAWKEYLKESLISYGVDSVWNDNCEYEGLVDKDSKVYFEGKGATIGQVKPLMSNIMCQLAVEAIKEENPGKRPFVVCRAGYSGIQRYAQTWAGDNLTCWDTLKYNIATILGMSLSGVANQGCDIGGFYGPAPDEELFLRWVQNGIFQPRFSIHSTNTDNTVTEPWMYSRVKGFIRAAIDFRYRLSPYLYSLMERSSRSGLPIVEPLVSAFQEDPDCYNESINFMLGEALLVANVVDKGATEKEIYLPANHVYYDFYTRERYEGGQTIHIPVTLESIPLFVKGGGILPMATNQMKNLAMDEVTGLTILCAPDEDGEFSLYEDDGSTTDYEKGIYRRTRIVMQAGEQTRLQFSTEGSYHSTVKNMYIDMIHREKSPYWIRLGEVELPRYLNRKKFEESDMGWYYSQTLKSVQIKYANIENDYTLVVSFQEFDLIGM